MRKLYRNAHKLLLALIVAGWYSPQAFDTGLSDWPAFFQAFRASAQAQSGTLEIRVTSGPPESVNSIMVTLRNIEVNASEDAVETGWLTVVAEPQEFDLVALQDVEEVLGSAMIEAGRYQQIRFEIVQTVLDIRGNIRDAAVPSEKLRLVGRFDVAAGATMVLTLHFDAGKSVVFQPGIGPKLSPVATLLIRSEGQTLAEASTVASVGEEATTTPPAAPDAGQDTIRVVIPTDDNLQFMSFWIALGAGFFSDEDLDVEVIVPPNPMGTGQFMLRGFADIALLTPPMYLDLIGEEAPIVVFANLLQNDQINLIVRQEVMDERQLSTTASLEERLRGISGLRVGVAPGPPVRLRILFDSVGLDAESDIEMVIVHGENQNQAFEDGLVDALYAHTPYLERALVQQGAVILVHQSAGEVPELTGRQNHSLVATRDYADAHRAELVAVGRAIHSAQQLAHTDQAAAVDAILQSGVPGLDRTLVETIVEIYAPAIPDTPAVSLEGVNRRLELYPAHRTPPDLSGIDVSQYVAPEIVNDAIR